MSEVVSIREFARRKGVSDTAIHKMIASGKIVQALTRKGERPALLADIAEQEFNNWAGGSHAASYVGSKRSNRAPEPKPAAPVKPAKSAKPESSKVSAPPAAPPPPVPAIEPDVDDEEVDEPEFVQGEAPVPRVQTDATMATAKKAQAVYTAKIKELEFKKLSGSLVDRKAVYQMLYSFGQEMRSALLSIPDRVVDEIRAENSRANAHTLLYEAISHELDKLANADKRQLSSDR